MLVRMWRNGNLCTLLVGMQIGAAAIENSVEVPQRIKNQTLVGSSNPTSEYISKGNGISILKRYPHSQVHCGTIHNFQDIESISVR